MEAGGRDGIDVSVWPAIMFAYGILACALSPGSVR